MSFYAEVMMHTALFMGFLPFFYFVFVAPIQLSSLVNDLFEIIQPTLTSMAVVSTPYDVNLLKNTISDDIKKGEQDPTIQKASDDMLAKNKKTSDQLTLIVSIVAPVLFVGALVVEFFSGGNIAHLLISNFIVLLFIAASEFMIVGLFLKNFIEIDSDYLKAIYAAQYVEPRWQRCQNVKDFIQSFSGNLIVK